MKRKTSLFALVGAILILSSCSTDYVYVEDVNIAGSTWKDTDTVTFIFDSKDSLSTYDVFIDFRITDNYDYGNLIFLVYSDADGQMNTDTVNLKLQQSDGTWNAMYSGNILTARFHAWQRKFKNKKPYVFKLVPYHRESEIEEVVSVGMAISEYIEE